MASVQETLYLLGQRFQNRLLTQAPIGSSRLPIADVYLLDALPDTTDTVQRAGEVISASDQRPVLIATTQITDTLAFAALSADVRGLITYNELPQQLPAALQVVANGGFWIPRSLLVRFLESSLAVARRTRFALGRAELSENDTVLLDAVLSRFSDEQIADRLRLPAGDVQNGVNRLLKTFGVRRRDDLVLLADQRSMAITVD